MIEKLKQFGAIKPEWLDGNRFEHRVQTGNYPDDPEFLSKMVPLKISANSTIQFFKMKTADGPKSMFEQMLKNTIEAEEAAAQRKAAEEAKPTYRKKFQNEQSLEEAQHAEAQKLVQEKYMLTQQLNYLEGVKNSQEAQQQTQLEAQQAEIVGQQNFNDQTGIMGDSKLDNEVQQMTVEGAATPTRHEF